MQCAYAPLDAVKHACVLKRTWGRGEVGHMGRIRHPGALESSRAARAHNRQSRGRGERDTHSSSAGMSDPAHRALYRALLLVVDNLPLHVHGHVPCLDVEEDAA